MHYSAGDLEETPERQPVSDSGNSGIPSSPAALFYTHRILANKMPLPISAERCTASLSQFMTAEKRSAEVLRAFAGVSEGGQSSASGASSSAAFPDLQPTTSRGLSSW